MAYWNDTAVVHDGLRIVSGGHGFAGIGRKPMLAPSKLREMKLENRIVVSPMAQYKAVDRCPTDWLFVHYAECANSILIADRADLAVIGRPHLADPYWTLHNEAKIEDDQAQWPLTYEADRDQAWRMGDREAEVIRK